MKGTADRKKGQVKALLSWGHRHYSAALPAGPCHRQYKRSVTRFTAHFCKMRQSSLSVLTGIFLLLCLHMAQPEWREQSGCRVCDRGGARVLSGGHGTSWDRCPARTHRCPPLTLWLRSSDVEKPGHCPEFTLRCPFLMIAQCRRDKGCKKDKKCCFYNCRHQCEDPWPSLD